MFKNNLRLQPGLFNTATYMHPRTRAMLKKSWAPLFYEHIFRKKIRDRGQVLKYHFFTTLLIRGFSNYFIMLLMIK